MTHDQETRLLTLAHECAMLTVEIQNDRGRAEGAEKTQLRAVGNSLEKASAVLARAVERLRA